MTNTSNEPSCDPESVTSLQESNNKDRSFLMRSGDSISAFSAATTFIIGFALYTTSFNGVVDEENSTLEKLGFIEENETLYYFSNVVLYIIFGLAQLALSYAMARRFRDIFPETIAFSQGLGIIWATLVLAAGMIGNVGTKTALDLLDDEPERAAALWDAVNTIQNSVGGGNEIVGGCWVLLVSLCEFLCSRFQKSPPTTKRCDAIYSKLTATTGVAAGLAGIVHTIPALENAGAAFGVIMIVWYIMVGILACKSN